MRSSARMANRQRDVDLLFTQVSSLSYNFGLAWLGWLSTLHTPHPAFEDGTDRGFRNAGKPQSDAGEIPKRTYTIFIYPIYNHNWRNISAIYIYKTRLASNDIFSPSNKIHREAGRAKNLSALLYRGADKSLARPGR